MTVPLDTADRKLLLLSGLLLAGLTVVALLSPVGRQASSTGFPSSYSTANDGAKAAYMLLGKMGYSVERWIQPPAELPAPSRNIVLIIASPSTLASFEEERQLREFVAQGGRLLLTGMVSADMVGATGVEPTPVDPDKWLTFAAELPAPLTLGAPAVTMQSYVRWVHQAAGQERYYGDREGATVTKFRIGKGEVIWWAGDSPLTNLGITRASNLELFLNSVGPPAQTRVLWDEYFHGVRLGLWHYLVGTPLPWALVQLVLLAIFVVLTFGRRSGAVRRISRESRLSPLEFVATLGGIYERRGEAAGALDIAYSHFRFLLARRLAIPSTATTGELIRRLQNRAGDSIPGFAVTLEHIDSALKLGKVTESQALRWIGQLYDFNARLGLDGMRRSGI